MESGSLRKEFHGREHREATTQAREKGPLACIVWGPLLSMDQGAHDLSGSRQKPLSAEHQCGSKLIFLEFQEFGMVGPRGLRRCQ